MEAKKQLRKPENWEDFERLCKKLWGEVWDCKEIKMNGRKGQSQHGIDVYGIPKGESSYFGIQCKGKDDYTHKQLSENEIDKEIELAKSFKPKLAKLYFATTANKDAKVEEYIRIKDIENREKGLFQIHIFSWEDIVDLIDENIETHDWYLNLNKFKVKADVHISFMNNENKLEVTVPYCQKYTHYKQRIIPASNPSLYSGNHVFSTIGGGIFENKRENKSYCRFKIKIKNIGNSPVTNPKLIFQLKGSYKSVEDENFENLFITHDVQTDIEINEDQKTITVTPTRQVLALDEEYVSNLICIKPNYEGSNIEIKWKLISNNLKKEGILQLNIATTLIRQDCDKFVDYKNEERVEDYIEDYFEENE